MTPKTNSMMLKSIKSYNKVVREGKAVKEGFTNASDMISSLEGLILSGGGDDTYISPISVKTPVSSSKKTTTTKKKTSEKSSSVPVTTIHVVDVLDASGSMNGAKYNAAVKGINLGVESLRADRAKVDYTYTLCDFSESVIFRHSMSILRAVDTFKGETRGSTSLYDAIGESIALIQRGMNSEDKVLVNIYTDGQENSSRNYTGHQIAESIKSLSSQGWTFTFIGTDQDVKYAQRHLHFADSNTLVHDNTGAGLEKAFLSNTASRSAYSAKVEKGEDVSTGFYKDIQ